MQDCLDIRAVLRLQVQSRHSKKVEVQRRHNCWRPMHRAEAGDEIQELALSPAGGMVQEQLVVVVLVDHQSQDYIQEVLIVLRRTALRRQRLVEGDLHHKS